MFPHMAFSVATQNKPGLDSAQFGFFLHNLRACESVVALAGVEKLIAAIWLTAIAKTAM